VTAIVPPPGATPGPGGSGGHGRRNIAIVVVVAVLAAAGVGFGIGLSRSGGPSPQQAAARAVDAYLAAWSRGDTEAMAVLSTDPAQVRLLAPQWRTAVGVKQLSAHATTVRSSASPGPAPTSAVPAPGAQFTAEIVNASYGAFAYTGNLPLRRAGDTWKVLFTPDALLPGFRPGDRVEADRTFGRRGQGLDRNGTPIRPRDAQLAEDVVGTVGKIAPETATASGAGWAPADTGGEGGLERVYNARLGGTPGGQLILVHADGTRAAVATRPAAAGADLRTTLDLTVQAAAERALGTLAIPGALVAIDVSTGGVLAVANSPAGGYNRALQTAVAPGSTFKIVTATAGLLAGRTPTSQLNCSATREAQGTTFKNSEDEAFGVIPFSLAFAKSCNTAFIDLEESLPAAAIAQAASLYGFDTGQPLPIRSTASTFPKETGRDPQTALGQGAVAASPLQMASVAAAVANGSWRQPFLADGPKTTRPLPAQVLPPLRSFMRQVVTEGTAATVGFTGDVYGKTGTAEHAGTKDAKGNDPTYAWFVGWRGNVAFAVFAGDSDVNAGFGADTAAPVAKRFLDQLPATIDAPQGSGAPAGSATGTPAATAGGNGTPTTP
jgi:hypothetical protein